MIDIVPAILTQNPQELREMIARCEGEAERVQIDIIDGIYVNNRTIDPKALEDLDTNLLLDFHLMVKEPINWIERCARAGADRIIGQIEMMSDQQEFVGKVQEVGKYVGLAIDLDTEVSQLDPVILTNLDAVLVMSVQAGFGGQKFDHRVLKKIDRLDELRSKDATPYRIIDDGGITVKNINDVRLQGVDEVAIGRALFQGNLAANIKKFQLAAYG